MFHQKNRRLIGTVTMGIILSFLILSGCQTPQTTSTPVFQSPDDPVQEFPSEPKPTLKRETSAEKFKQWPLQRAIIKNELAKMLEDWGEPAFAVDDVLVRHVSYFYKYYSVVDYKRSNRAIARSEKYLPYIIKVFQKYQLPEDIAFALPFVESSFNPKAKSGVGAAGMFQFMKATGKQYGLKVTRSQDDRLDPYKAAPACAKYLRNNRNVFASSVLSLGSYHHGTGKVSQVLLTAANADERSFGPIFNHKRLGRYSREYIPQCLSAALMYRFMKSMGINRLPKMNFKKQTLSKKVSSDALAKQLPDVFTMNPDLKGGIQTYAYASTNGYVLLSHVDIGKIDLAKAIALPTAKSVQINEPPVFEPKRSAYEWSSNPSVKPSGRSKVTGSAKYIRYVFQKGNKLSVIASIFGTKTSKIKQTKENRYLNRRSPRPGDVIRIEGLSPTTQKLGGGGYVCGRRQELITRNRESIKSLCRRVKTTIQKSCRKNQWQMGADITPELIYYWNKDVLEDISPDTPLSGGISLVVYTDYLWFKAKQTSSSRSTRPVSSKSVSGRRTGSKYVTYVVQDQNIREGNLIQNLCEIFHINAKELLAWNPALKSFQRNPNAWIGKKYRLKIKNCPNTVQKFGNPGVVCRKGQDTRLLINAGETLNDAVEKAIKIVQGCGGRGKGITAKNILYWNADILGRSGISDINDAATRAVKVTVYVDYY